MSKLKIPKTIIQTSIEKQPIYVVEMIMSHCTGWEYIHFNDDQIIRFFKENLIEEFSDIIGKYHSFSNGAHRADLFRYYYLYINGGVYLDSDAMLEMHIENMLEANEFVSINGYHNDKSMLFNGFIGVVKNDPIMYNALKDIFSIEDHQLSEDYHLICKNLFKIVKNDQREAIKIYQEKKVRSFKPGVITYDENGSKILTHYCYIKKIPDYTKKWPAFFYKTIYNNRLFYKIYKKIVTVQRSLNK